MSALKFTPGPWEAQSKGFARHPYPHGDIGGWAVYADKAEPGLRMPAECIGPDAEANARLIAAAPELYEALIYLSNRAGTDRDFDDAWDDSGAAAALAKAEGK